MLPANSKRAKTKWGEAKAWAEAEIDRQFSDTSNVGIALGARSSDLVDIDFDCSEAAQFGRILLPSLPSFGRRSSPESHRVLHSKLNKNRTVYQLPKNLVDASDADRAMLQVKQSLGQKVLSKSLNWTKPSF